MNFQVMEAVIIVDNITTTEKLILLVLGNYANEKKQCCPSYGKLAEMALCSKSTAIRAIKSLSDKGLIKVHKRKLSSQDNQTNIYTIKCSATPSEPKNAIYH